MRLCAAPLKRPCDAAFYVILIGANRPHRLIVRTINTETAKQPIRCCVPEAPVKLKALSLRDDAQTAPSEHLIDLGGRLGHAEKKALNFCATLLA